MANITLDKLKTIVQSIVASVTRYKPNLSVNDPDDPRYVAGRLCYKTVKAVDDVKETTVTFAENEGMYASTEMLPIPSVQAAGDVRTVVWDGVAYVCKAADYGGGMGYTLGNLSLLNGLVEESYPDTGEPFVWMVIPQYGVSSMATADTAETHTVRCYGEKKVIHALPKEYLPEIPVEKIPDLGLANVATSGSYNDLSDKPEIPSNVVKTVYSAEPDENGDVSPEKIAFSNGSYLRSSGLYMYDYDDPIDCNTSNGLVVGNTSKKYIKLQSSNRTDGEATIRVGQSDNYITLYSDGVILVGGKVLKLGVTKNSPSIVRYVKTPEEDSDAANKAYVDGKISDTEIILASSTEGSTKRFKITVDDSGTLSATEVTV